jgi:hypothetical protein
MNVQASFHYQERVPHSLHLGFLSSAPDSRLFSPTFKVWALKITGDNRRTHPAAALSMPARIFGHDGNDSPIAGVYYLWDRWGHRSRFPKEA